MRPLPSSNGWTDSKYKCADPALVSAGSGSVPPRAERLNQSINPAISRGTCADGGASKWIFGAPIAPETTCMLIAGSIKSDIFNVPPAAHQHSVPSEYHLLGKRG